MTVYRPWSSQLGDQIGTMNLLIRKAALRCLYRKPGTPIERIKIHSVGNLNRIHRELLDVLGANSMIELTEERPTHGLNGYDVWAAAPVKTTVQWCDFDYRQDGHEFVTYQFDGISAAADKNPSPAEVEILERWLAQSGFKPVRLGKHLSISACVDALARSAFFIGVDSGLSHLAHATGVPIFLLQFRLPVVTSHRGRPYILCDGVEDALRWKIPTVVDLWRFIDHPDGKKSTVFVGREEREAQPGQWWWPA